MVGVRIQSPRFFGLRLYLGAGGLFLVHAQTKNISKRVRGYLKLLLGRAAALADKKCSSAVLCFVVRCCSGRNGEISYVFTRSVRLLITSVSGAFSGRIMTGCLSFYVYCHFTLVLLKSFVARLTSSFLSQSGSLFRRI